jgi:hypothetical protein
MEKSILKDDQDVAIRKQTPEERKRLDTTEEIPEYRISLKLNETQKKALTDQVFLEFDALKREREELGLEKKWKELDNQYDGELRKNDMLPFNLHVQQSKIKVDAVVRSICQAFLESEPIVDISPRPDMGRKDGYEVAQRQTEFIDYSMDEEVKPEASLSKIAKSAVTKFVGIGKLCWSYRREKRRREESYEGENRVIGQAGGQLITDNEGLRQFLSVYPDAMKTQNGLVKQLLEEKKVNIVVEYRDTIENNPELKHVKLENFYVKNSTEYWNGLRTAHCTVERQNYTYWELKKKQDNGEFENIEALFNQDKKDGEQGQAEDYKTADYDVLEVTTYFSMKDGEDEIKIKAWFGEDKKTFLGAILYPYYAYDTDYIPFYVTLNEDGFFGGAKSVMADLRDSNIAQDVLLNLLLTGQLARNTMTPIVEAGSETESLLLEHKWGFGKPIPVDGLTDDVNKAIGFVQFPPVDMNANMTIMEFLQKIDSDVTRVSDLQASGSTSNLDPSAPASKTIALLQQSGIGIKDYIRTFLPSFNIFCTMLLQLYYQMSQEGKEYKIRRKSETVTGGDVFGQITRDQMMARTNIQARASAFVFDKVGEKNEAMAGYQIVTTNPYLIQNPTAQYEALKLMLQSLGGRWKNLADKLPSPEDFKKQQMGVAVKAMQMLLQKASEYQQNTGTEPEMNPEMMGDMVTRAQSESFNPALAQQGAQ